MPRTYVDDNFGIWDNMDDPDNIEFYNQVQKESRTKICKGCRQRVKLRPDYAYCNTCADTLVRGGDLNY